MDFTDFFIYIKDMDKYVVSFTTRKFITSEDMDECRRNGIVYDLAKSVIEKLRLDTLEYLLELEKRIDTEGIRIRDARIREPNLKIQSLN